MTELWPLGPIVLPHEFVVDGHHFELPEIRSAVLLGWLAAGEWWRLFPGSVDDLPLAPLGRRMRDDHDDFGFVHLHAVATGLMGGLAGLATSTSTGWWPARRLAAAAVSTWPSYSAWCASHATPTLDKPLHEVIGGIYAWVRSGVPPQGWEVLDHNIWAPPPYVRSPAATADHLPEHVREAEAAAAMATLMETLPGEQPEAEWSAQ